MNQTLTEVLALREFAEERLVAHLRAVGNANNEHRKKLFNDHLLEYIRELNDKCREINGADYGDGTGPYKSMYALINDYQNRFMARY